MHLQSYAAAIPIAARPNLPESTATYCTYLKPYRVMSCNVMSSHIMSCRVMCGLASQQARQKVDLSPCRSEEGERHQLSLSRPPVEAHVLLSDFICLLLRLLLLT